MVRLPCVFLRALSLAGLCVKGKGIPSLRGGGRGDQLVRIKVVVPTKINEKQKDVLRKFEEVCGDAINPEKKSFMDKIKGLKGLFK